MKQFERLIDTAFSLGACDKLSVDMNAKNLSELLFSPQGREFCVLNDFPSCQDLNHIRDNTLTKNKIFKAKNGLNLHNPSDICLINSDAEITIETPSVLHHIVLLEKSFVKLKASKHCVVSVDISESSYIEIINDGTASVYVNGKGKVIS